MGKGNPNPKNQWKPGQVTNPKGRPKKVDDIGRYIRMRLAKIPEGKNKRYVYYLVSSLLKKGINDNDVIAIRELMDRGYGKAPQKIDMTINPKSELDKALKRIDEYESKDGDDKKKEAEQVPEKGD